MFLQWKTAFWPEKHLIADVKKKRHNKRDTCKVKLMPPQIMNFDTWRFCICKTLTELRKSRIVTVHVAAGTGTWRCTVSGLHQQELMWKLKCVFVCASDEQFPVGLCHPYIWGLVLFYTLILSIICFINCFFFSVRLMTDTNTMGLFKISPLYLFLFPLLCCVNSLSRAGECWW